MAGRFQGTDIAGHTAEVGWGVGRDASRAGHLAGLDAGLPLSMREKAPSEPIWEMHVRDGEIPGFAQKNQWEAKMPGGQENSVRVGTQWKQTRAVPANWDNCPPEPWA